MPTLPTDVDAHMERYDVIVISCYTRFDNLAHGPRGREASHGMYTYCLDRNDGQMLLLSVDTEPIMNPAFSRYNSKHKVLYSCTESVAENGQIVSWKLDSRTGKLTRIGSIDAGGTSTCYITLDKEFNSILVVNYWDASLRTIRLDAQGLPTEIISSYEPNADRGMVAKADKHVNHSRNDLDAQKDRQADPHSHALVLDPVFGRIAFVPDLGKDVIWQFTYEPVSGKLKLLGSCPSGLIGRDNTALGPRYIEFHKTFPICYVINEFSAEVDVFEFDEMLAKKCIEEGTADGKSLSTLRHLQTISTLPEAFPISLNTCGRIAVHCSGEFVVVANRGHDSLAVFRIYSESSPPGLLELSGIYHTRGQTPRHFKFDRSGQWLIAANQDTNSVCVFQFNLATGALTWTGYEYSVPSPNFVEVIKPKDNDENVRSGIKKKK